jgi:hypothetical protein
MQRLACSRWSLWLVFVDVDRRERPLPIVIVVVCVECAYRRVRRRNDDGLDAHPFPETDPDVEMARERGLDTSSICDRRRWWCQCGSGVHETQIENDAHCARESMLDVAKTSAVAAHGRRCSGSWWLRSEREVEFKFEGRLARNLVHGRLATTPPPCPIVRQPMVVLHPQVQVGKWAATQRPCVWRR